MDGLSRLAWSTNSVPADDCFAVIISRPNPLTLSPGDQLDLMQVLWNEGPHSESIPLSTNAQHAGLELRLPDCTAYTKAATPPEEAKTSKSK